MNAGTVEAVVGLPLNEKEEEHQSRDRLGYHALSEEEQRDRAIEIDPEILGGGDNGLYSSDEDSVDSSRSGRRIDHIAVMRLAGSNWHNISQELKEGWKERAAWLNSRPVPGKFLELPANLNQADVLKSITLDWVRVVSLFRNMITRRPRALAYRSFEMSYIIQMCIFGKEWSKLRKRDEIISQTKKASLFHIASEQRIKSLFNMYNLCATVFKISGRRHTCCGKVNTVMNGLSCVGYILEENAVNNTWRIQLLTNEVVVMEKPAFDIESGKYHYASIAEINVRFIQQYWPIRISIRRNGSGKITLNRVAFDNEDNIIVMHSS
eukprot:scaffold90288_cov52-Attheya_sp.AAC.6